MADNEQMATDVRPQPTGRRIARRRGRGGLANDAVFVAVQAANSSQQLPSTSPRPPIRDWPGLVWPVLPALIVGLSMVFTTPSEYPCGAAFRLDGETPPARREMIRKELLDCAWRQTTDTEPSLARDLRWFVDSPTDELLQVIATTADRAAGVDLAAAIAQRFMASLEAKSQEARSTPTESERALLERVAEIREQLRDAETRVGQALARLPGNDPRDQRDALLTKWQGLRSEFAGAREQLVLASTEIAGLRSEPEPTHGIVSSETRRAAFSADLALQEDLRELTVRLSELKQHLTAAWQRATAKLEPLVTASNRLLEWSAHGDTTRLPQAVRDGVAGVGVEAAKYRELLATFATSWQSDGRLLQSLAIDPQSGELLDVHQRARASLHDFLFAAGSSLSGLRHHVNAISESQSDNARHHVLQSDLVRVFQALQAAHHQVEFAAGEISAPDNFRLDAALRSAHGLRRRTREEMRIIEQRLAEEAAAEVKERRAEAAARAERFVAQLRSVSDQTVSELLSLQDRLTTHVTLTEDSVRAILETQVATGQLRSLQRDAARAETRLRQLEAERLHGDNSAGVTCVSCGILGPPVNSREKLRVGAVAALVTLVAVSFGNRWLSRRSPPLPRAAIR